MHCSALHINAQKQAPAAHVLALNRERNQAQPFLPGYKDSRITVNLVRNHLSPYFLTNTIIYDRINRISKGIVSVISAETVLYLRHLFPLRLRCLLPHDSMKFLHYLII